MERGERPPSDANLADIASVEGLGISLRKLRAWRAADRIADDIELLKEEAPEILGLPPHPYSAFAGPGAPPLNDDEIQALDSRFVMTKHWILAAWFQSTTAGGFRSASTMVDSIGPGARP